MLAVRVLQNGPVGTLLEPFDFEASRLTFSTDGHYLAASGSRPVAAWNAEGESITLQAVDDRSQMASALVALDPWSQRVVELEWRGHEIRSWRISDGLLVDSLHVSAAPGSSILLSPDGEHFLEMQPVPLGTELIYHRIGHERGGDGQGNESGEPPSLLRRTVPGSIADHGFLVLRPGSQWPAALEPTGRWLAWAGEGGVDVADLSRPEAPTRRFEVATVEPADAVVAVAFAANGEWLAAYTGEGEIFAWNLKEAGPVIRRKGPGWPGSVSLSANGRFLAVSSIDHRAASVWDLSGPPTAEPVVLLYGPVGQINHVAFHPQRDELAVATGATGVLISPWPIEERPVILQPSRTRVRDVGFRPDSRSIWVLAGDSTASSVRLASSVAHQAAPPALNVQHVLAIQAPTGRMLVQPDDGGLGLARRGDDSSSVLDLRETLLVRDAGFSHVGARVAVLGRSQPRSPLGVWVWSTESGDLVGDFEVRRASTIEMLDRDTVLTCGSDGLVAWRVADGVRSDLLEMCEVATVVPGAARVAVGARGRIRVAQLTAAAGLWRVSSVAEAPAHQTSMDVTALALRLDGELLASADAAGVTRVSRLGEEHAHLLFGAENPVRALRFHPTRDQIAVAADDGKVALWHLPAGEPLHVRAHDELLRDLAARTNVRFVPDAEEPGGFRLHLEGAPER